MFGFFELERLWFGNALPEQLRWFYTARGFILGGCCTLTAWTIIRKQREQLRKADAVFRELIEASPGAVIGADAGGRINYANPAAHTLFRREDLTGKPLTILMPPEYRAAHLAGWIRFLRYRKSKLAGREILGLEGERGTGPRSPWR